MDVGFAFTACSPPAVMLPRELLKRGETVQSSRQLMRLQDKTNNQCSLILHFQSSRLKILYLICRERSLTYPDTQNNSYTLFFAPTTRTWRPHGE